VVFLFPCIGPRCFSFYFFGDAVPARALPVSPAPPNRGFIFLLVGKRPSTGAIRLRDRVLFLAAILPYGQGLGQPNPFWRFFFFFRVFFPRRCWVHPTFHVFRWRQFRPFSAALPHDHRIVPLQLLCLGGVGVCFRMFLKTPSSPSFVFHSGIPWERDDQGFPTPVTGPLARPPDSSSFLGPGSFSRSVAPVSFEWSLSRALVAFPPPLKLPITPHSSLSTPVGLFGFSFCLSPFFSRSLLCPESRFENSGFSGFFPGARRTGCALFQVVPSQFFFRRGPASLSYAGRPMRFPHLSPEFFSAGEGETGPVSALNSFFSPLL